METTRLLKIICAILTVAVGLGAATLYGKVRSEHQRLLFRNKFSKPEEVVKYYTARDASGFVWSGLLEIERKAYTHWKGVPRSDSFYIAKQYKVLPAKIKGANAVVQVKYQLVGIGDATGTWLPADQSNYSVNFRLKKSKGRWKIASPAHNRISPVVVESKFPYARGEH